MLVTELLAARVHTVLCVSRPSPCPPPKLPLPPPLSVSKEPVSPFTPRTGGKSARRLGNVVAPELCLFGCCWLAAGADGRGGVLHTTCSLSIFHTLLSWDGDDLDIRRCSRGGGVGGFHSMHYCLWSPFSLGRCWAMAIHSFMLGTWDVILYVGLDAPGWTHCGLDDLL